MAHQYPASPRQALPATPPSGSRFREVPYAHAGNGTRLRQERPCCTDVSMVNGANRSSARPGHDIERRNGSLPIGELSGVENRASGVMPHARAPRRAVSDSIRSRNAYGMDKFTLGKILNVS